ncbi:MAG: hypothetical protein ABIR06_20730, partial [Cyclobacteriaceae bacterium]
RDCLICPPAGGFVSTDLCSPAFFSSRITPHNLAALLRRSFGGRGLLMRIDAVHIGDLHPLDNLFTFPVECNTPYWAHHKVFIYLRGAV